MYLMGKNEVGKLMFGRAKTVATILRVFAVLALAGGLIGAAVAFGFQAGAGISLAVYGVLVAAFLDALAWLLDLLRGILAGVWHAAWRLDELAERQVDEEELS